MVKKGRDRRDQYYHLAKESGYRSRAAFKLLQLDSKLGFLSSARSVVDLCAAPGGWLQAASERMPSGSLLIGVDLVPIRPIRGAITLQGDITTQECRSAIIREMKGWMADVVIHDGAPNVGGNWSREAFEQNCLVLAALKLASNVLKKGGHFVTKAFRSQDYTALLGVLRKMFSKVHATKPAASRTVSAEIFVVCMNYTPLDPKEAIDLFDPGKVFVASSAPAGSSMQPVKGGEAAASAILKERKRLHRHREGYDENAAGTVPYGALSAQEFVRCTDGTHAKMLADSRCIALDDPRILEHPLTTAEIKECCNDVRVLGRRELKLLLAWRVKIAKMLNREEKRDAGEKDDKDESKEKEQLDEEDNEEERVEKQIQSLKDAESRRLKKKLKKTREAKIAAHKRMTADPEAAKFRSVHDLLLEEEGEARELFSLKQLKNKAALEVTMDDSEAQVLASSSSEEENDEELLMKRRKKVVSYNIDEDREYDDEELEPPKLDPEEKLKKRKKKDRKDKKKKRKGDDDSEGDIDVDENADVKIDANDEYPLAVSCETTSERDRRCIDQWESAVSSFISNKNIKRDGGDDDELSDNSKDFGNELADWELEAMAKIKGAVKKDNGDKSPITEIKNINSKQTESSTDSDDSTESEDADIVGKVSRPDFVADPVSLALGSKLATSRKSRRELIESGYNRYAFGPEEGLPSWFADNERLHSQPTLPITAQEIKIYKERMKALDARPIKKVAEARARKKRRMMTKIESARKEAEKLQENDQMTDVEKQGAMKRIYRSARSATRKENRVQTVMARGRATGKRTVRPPGVKGRYKVVDTRMKKDLRAQQNAAKKGKKRKR